MGPPRAATAAAAEKENRAIGAAAAWRGGYPRHSVAGDPMVGAGCGVAPQPYSVFFCDLEQGPSQRFASSPKRQWK